VARSIARVTTDTPQRFARQLVSHLGHRVPVTRTGEEARLSFGSGSGTVRSGGGELVLVAEAATPAGLAEVQDVLARHLVRFGERQGLSVTWESDSST
jgi:hypothetical protein